MPSARRTTKSPMSSLRKLCGPCTKSVNAMRSPRGTRKRSVAASRCACAARALGDGQLAAGARHSAAAARRRAARAATAPAPAACRSTGRPASCCSSSREIARVQGARAATGGTGRAHPRGPDPRPTRCRASAGPPSAPRVWLSTAALACPYPRSAAQSARPPRRASSRLNSAVRALPRCSSPVGLGAKRVTARRGCSPAAADFARLHDAMLRETHESQQSAARRRTAIKSAAGAAARNPRRIDAHSSPGPAFALLAGLTLAALVCCWRRAPPAQAAGASHPGAGHAPAWVTSSSSCAPTAHR